MAIWSGVLPALRSAQIWCPTAMMSDGGKVTGRPVVTPFGNAAADTDGEAPHVTPRVMVTGVAAKIGEITKLRDEGRLTDEEYEKLKKQLLGR